MLMQYDNLQQIKMELLLYRMANAEPKTNQFCIKFSWVLQRNFHRILQIVKDILVFQLNVRLK